MLYSEPRSSTSRCRRVRRADPGRHRRRYGPGARGAVRPRRAARAGGPGAKALRSRDLLAVIALKYLAGWSRAEIAQVLGVDPRRINVFERAALERMREALNERPE